MTADAEPFTVISGGQTGADRAALDFAINHGFAHGGWCPRGRLAEDGPIAPAYRLRETESPRYDDRTRRNIDDSDATVVFSLGSRPSGGTRLTLDYARRSGKPVLHLVASAAKPVAAHASALRGFLVAHGVRRLNVAGPRASQAPRVGAFVTAVLSAAIAPPKQREPAGRVASPQGVTQTPEPRDGRPRLDLYGGDTPR